MIQSDYVTINFRGEPGDLNNPGPSISTRETVVFIFLLAREYGSTWPVVRAYEGLHPVRRQEGPLILLLYLMGVPGL